MDSLPPLLPIAQAMVFAGLTAALAHVKGRKIWLWLVLGLLFQILALIVLAFLPRPAPATGEAPHRPDCLERSFGLLAVLMAGSFVGLLVVFVANAGAGEFEFMTDTGWIALLAYLIIFLPLLAWRIKKAFEPPS